MTPFIIYALPRSRTAWLSRFLTYGEWVCGHDELRHCRSLDDVKTWLSQPCTGTVETAAAPYWRLAETYAPGARVVVVRRPAPEVVDSLLRLGGPADRELLTYEMRRLDRKLEQIERRIPGALSVSFADLERQETCARVFEHCLPYKHDPSWWSALAPINIQINFMALMRYCTAYRAKFEKLAGHAKQQTLLNMARRPVREADGLSIQVEPFEDFYRDGERLFKEHLLATDHEVDGYTRKNLPLMRRMDELGCMQIVTARSNGRMFGYLMSIIGPSLEDENIISALHMTSFASKDFPGLGLKLQRAAAGFLRQRGVTELFMRSGVRGSGPKMGALYRRLGAEEFGQLFRLELEGT